MRYNHMLLCHYHTFLIFTSYAHYAPSTLRKHDNHAFSVLRNIPILFTYLPFSHHIIYILPCIYYIHTIHIMCHFIYTPYTSYTDHIHTIHTTYLSHVMSCTMNNHTLCIMLLYVYLRPQHTNVSSVSSICLRPQHTNMHHLYLCAPNTPI